MRKKYSKSVLFVRTDVKMQDFGDLQWDFICVNKRDVHHKEGKKFYFRVSFQVKQI